ncbi:hypothetical protein [Natrialba sp. INN-245]|uniref:hypothetical protein n=1 Tax=Natrialba sp. INN-245 TaxID=2690967 RepID=UPI001311522F|nr:hypothetical protein [Natrialba sp. INN-245]MWV40897.1 hypothetical protein [Natrialba sp. INN-245]
MSNKPPSPSITSPSPTECDGDDRVVATTPELVASIESSTGHQLEEAALEELLIVLDRADCLEWVSVTRTGDYVWDLTDTPDQIAAVVADVVVEQLCSWLSASGRGTSEAGITDE